MRVLNRHLTAYFRDRCLPGDAVHGYVPGRSILTNAKAHAGAAFIVKADIADFFRAITAETVERRLRDLGLGKRCAELLARVSCIEGRLGLGIATAPTLANLVASELDTAFIKLALQTESVYTRYADDLTFSGARVPPSQNDISEVLESHRFGLAEGKFCKKKRGQAVVVTGLTVVDPDRPRVPKKFKRRIRQELHYIEKHGFVSHAERTRPSDWKTCLNRLDGQIQFVRGIERVLGEALNKKWQALLKKDGIHPVWQSQQSSTSRFSLYVDESEVKFGSERVLLLGMVLCRDDDCVSSRVAKTIKKLRDDWRLSGSGGTQLKKNVLHFCELSKDAQLVVARLIEGLPVRGFVAYGILKTDKEYHSLWLELYRGLIRSRFMRLDRQELSTGQSHYKKRDKSCSWADADNVKHVVWVPCGAESAILDADLH